MRSRVHPLRDGGEGDERGEEQDALHDRGSFREVRLPTGERARRSRTRNAATSGGLKPRARPVPQRPPRSELTPEEPPRGPREPAELAPAISTRTPFRRSWRGAAWHSAQERFHRGTIADCTRRCPIDRDHSRIVLRTPLRSTALEARSMASHLKGKTLFITGASRGIGKAIALRAARDGANVVIAAKTAEPHPKLPGTIYTAEGGDRGGRRQGARLHRRRPHRGADPRGRRSRRCATFGGIDILVNNASAISLTGTRRHADEALRPHARRSTRAARSRARRRASRTSRRRENPHILNISPPLNMEAKWFAPHVAYTMAKYGMSMCVLGMAEELKGQRDRRQRALAEDRHRDRGRAEPARRRRDRKGQPKARHHGGRGPRDPHAEEHRIHRPLLRRRGRLARGRCDRLLALFDDTGDEGLGALPGLFSLIDWSRPGRSLLNSRLRGGFGGRVGGCDVL